MAKGKFKVGSLSIKINVEDKRFSAALQKKMNDFIKNGELLEQIASMAMIQLRKKEFKGLTSSTITWRKQVAKFNPTHSRYSAGRSNLTLSGEFIDSIVSKINRGKSLITIFPEGNHPGYFGANGQPTRKNQPRNIDIAKGQKEMGRDIFKLTNKNRAKILALVKKKFKKEFGN